MYYVIAGPTASGKSQYAMDLAAKCNGEIVNFDSVQVYRGFDIGSAKPTLEDQQAVSHHLIDLVEWHESFDAGKFALIARERVADILRRGKTPILVGGTGLYLRAFWGDGFHDNLPKDEHLRARLQKKDPKHLYMLLKRLDPERARELHPNDQFRIIRALELRILLGHSIKQLQGHTSQLREQAKVVYLNPDRAKLRERINLRVKNMLEQGLVDEVRRLLDSGVKDTSHPMKTIGYRQVVDVLCHQAPQQDLEHKIFVATCQYAKRQRTWFKKYLG